MAQSEYQIKDLYMTTWELDSINYLSAELSLKNHVTQIIEETTFSHI